MTGYRVDRQKWAGLSLFEQLGNIGSEVGRAFEAKRRGDTIATRAATQRALDLFDATTGQGRLTYPRLKEVLRAREQFVSSIDSSDPGQSLENYFMQFAIAARIKH